MAEGLVNKFKVNWRGLGILAKQGCQRRQCVGMEADSDMGWERENFDTYGGRSVGM